MENLLYILIAFLIFMFMVTVHEAGHYTAGKIFKFKIEEFAIGMGPKLFSRKSKKTGEVFSVRIIPLGGFCAFADEAGTESNEGEKINGFTSHKPWQRIIVFVSGAAFNFISAILIVIIAFTAFGTFMPEVGSLVPGSPAETALSEAEAAGDYSRVLMPGDILLEVNGHKILLNTDLSKYLAESAEGRNTAFLVIRDGRRVFLSGVAKGTYITQKLDGEGNPVFKENGEPDMDTRRGLGIYLAAESPAVRFSLGESILRSVPYSLSAAGAILGAFGQLITGALGLKEIGGPITTIDVTAQVARSGFMNILYLITLISINLAVFNLLPIPALDGSKVIFTLIEWIRGKPINRTVENYIHLVGLLLLIGSVILIDIIKYL